MTPELLDRFTSESLFYLRNLAFQIRDGQKDIGAGDFLSLLRQTIGRGVTPKGKMLFIGDNPHATLFLIQDGHSNKLDIFLSSITFTPLREISYP